MNFYEVEKKIYSDRKGGAGIYGTRDDGDLRKSEKEQMFIKSS